MTKIGILVHCRNLNTIAWEDLVFGQPKQGKLGDHATLAKVLLTLGKDEEVCIVLGGGPSQRDGVSEGDYSKKFLLDNLDRLEEFQSLQSLFANLSDEERMVFRKSMENVIVSSRIANTREEVVEAARIFNEAGVDKVIQITAASHASSCIKEQTILRAKGMIDTNQLWHVIATDMSYHDTQPEDVCVIEPPHRLDQPLTYVRPGLSEVIAPYFSFGDEDKKAFIGAVSEFMTARNHLP